MLTENQQHEALAELPGNLGFQVLLEMLEEQQHETLKALSEAKDDQHILRLARLWQTQFKYLNVMGTQPQALKEFLAQQHEEFQDQLVGDPLFPPHRRQQLKELEELTEPKRKTK